MRKEDDFWEQFERTGRILDYLNYTACANEDAGRGSGKEYECKNERSAGCDGDRTILHAGG